MITTPNLAAPSTIILLFLLSHFGDDETEAPHGYELKQGHTAASVRGHTNASCTQVSDLMLSATAFPCVCVPLPAGIGTPPPTAPCGATKHREIYLHVSLVVPCTVATAHTGRWTGPHTLVLATPCAWSEGF